MRIMKAFALIVGLLTAPQAMAAYGGVTLGQDQTTPTATPVCVMYGTTCKAQIGTYNGSTGVWTLPSGFNLPGVGPLGEGVGPALGVAANANGGFPIVSVSATAPSVPSLFQPWLDTTAAPYVWKIWTGAWTAIGTLDPTTHAFTSPTLDLAATPSGGFGGVSGNLPIANMPQIGASTFLCNSTAGSAAPTACSGLTAEGLLQFQNTGAGAATWSAQQRGQTTLNLLDYATSPVQGNGVVDDAPMFRAAYAACVSSGFRAVYVPQPSVGYLLKSLASDGTAALVIGDGQAITATLSITSGQAVLTATTSIFTSAMVGASIDVPGAGAAGATLITKVLSYQSPTQITLAANASTTLSGASETLQIGHSNTCDFEGEAMNVAWPSPFLQNGSLGVYVQLGNGLNRPIIRVATKAGSPTFTNFYFNANRAFQTGWAGGALSKLWAIQVDDGSAVVEGSIRLKGTIIAAGYNGALYVGAGRGATLIRDSYFVQNGTTTADWTIYLNGYDAVMEASGIGSSTGGGMLFAEGGQYHLNDNAIWMSGADAIGINGGAVTYLMASNTNLQWNACNGIREYSHLGNTGAHLFTNTVFDGNNAGNTTCVDVQADGAGVSLANSQFLGTTSSTGFKPKYNIGGTGAVKSANPIFGASSAVTAHYQYPSVVQCSNCDETFSWTPSVAGATTAGTFTPSVQIGEWVRTNNQVRYSFKVQGVLTGAAGGMMITGLPFYNGSTGDPGSCTFSYVSGWTAQAGYVTLAGIMGAISTSILLYENASGLVPAQALVGEFGTFVLIGSCVANL